MRSMEYCTGLLVWGLEVCVQLVVGGVCVAEVRGGGLTCWGLCPNTLNLLASYNAAPHNRYQLHPAEPAQYTVCSNTRSFFS
jgi:hypothetical protein